MSPVPFNLRVQRWGDQPWTVCGDRHAPCRRSQCVRL